GAFRDLAQLANPLPLFVHGVTDDRPIRGKLGEEQRLGGLADRLVGRPAVEARGTFIPVDDPLVEVADENGVTGFVEQGGLFADFLLGLFALGDVGVDDEDGFGSAAGVAD